MATYTEEEAKQRWCPVANTRLLVYGGPGIAGDRCMASGCMSWRWADVSKSTLSSGKSTTHGFCGLAGKP